MSGLRHNLKAASSSACWRIGASRSPDFFYYPSRRQQPAALTALINVLRL